MPKELGTDLTGLTLKAALDGLKSKQFASAEITQAHVDAVAASKSLNAYVLADRGTWISFKNRGDLVIAVEGDNRLFNQYGVMLVNPAKYPHVKKELGQAFIDWLISPEGQTVIAGYKIDGQQLFFPNATVPGA